MKVVDLATQIHAEISYDSSTSIPAIAYWVRNQIGRINNLLFEDFIIEENSGQFEILDGDGVEISIEAAAVIVSLYKVYDYGVQVRSTMNALNTDSIVEFTDNLQGSTIRRTDKSTAAKVFVSLKSAEQQNLNDLITAYRMKGAVPAQVVGDDTTIGVYNENNPTVRQNVVL